MPKVDKNKSKKDKEKQNKIFKEPPPTLDMCRTKTAKKMGPNSHKDTPTTTTGSANSLPVLMKPLIPDEVLSEYFQSPMTSPLIPQDGSPFLKNKKYVQDTLV